VFFACAAAAGVVASELMFPNAGEPG